MTGMLLGNWRCVSRENVAGNMNEEALKEHMLSRTPLLPLS